MLPAVPRRRPQLLLSLALLAGAGSGCGPSDEELMAYGPNLVWQACDMGMVLDEDGECQGVAELYEWEEAIDACLMLSAEDPGNFRLPTEIELRGELLRHPELTPARRWIDTWDLDAEEPGPEVLDPAGFKRRQKPESKRRVRCVHDGPR